MAKLGIELTKLILILAKDRELHEPGDGKRPRIFLPDLSYLGEYETRGNGNLIFRNARRKLAVATEGRFSRHLDSY